MNAPAALLGALCESVGVPSTARPGAASRPTVLEHNGRRPGAIAPGARERVGTIVASLTRQRSELATARAYRLAMEALERRRTAIIASRPQVCPSCTGSRRAVDNDNNVTRCDTCAGQGIVAR